MITQDNRSAINRSIARLKACHAGTSHLEPAVLAGRTDQLFTTWCRIIRNLTKRVYNEMHG